MEQLEDTGPFEKMLCRRHWNGGEIDRGRSEQGEVHRSEDRLCSTGAAVGVFWEEGVGWTGNLGFIEANYCLWNGLAMRSRYIALGTMSSHL